jgi:tagatose-1,6-bisphosphate aldolase
MTLNIGKRRGLAQCATAQGAFAILALDQRGNLRQLLDPADPDSVQFPRLVEFKRQVIAALAPQSSAALIDPEIGAGQVVGGGQLPGNVGLLVSLEQTGYTGDPAGRLTKIQPGWSVGKIRRMGASAVKLLVYYHPEARQAADQERLVSQVAEDCARYDLPLFLEPLSYSLDPGKKKLPSEEKQQVVLETARRLTPLGVDVLKAEFPLDIQEETDERVWMAACAGLTKSSRVPWVLLSAGIGFEEFLKQVRVACEAGASGVLAGRAIWKEAAQLEGQARIGFLRSTAVERMYKLRCLCEAIARPYTDHYPVEEGDLQDWYAGYQDL